MRRSLYLKQDPPCGDWALALHQKSHHGYWLDCKQGKSGNQERNAAIFDHCTLTNMQRLFESFQKPNSLILIDQLC